MEPITLEPVDALTITTLVDNVSDILLADAGPAKRAPFALATTGNALRAEHGFSCLVTITKAAQPTRVLFDAGLTPDGLIENMRRLGLSPHDIDIIVLSHGHWDHTTGMDGLVAAMGRRSVPVLIHPEFWSRRVALPDREPIELPSTSRSALQGAGFEIVEQQQPLFLLVGGFHLSGPQFEPLIAPTCDALAALAPDYVVPSHCTRWRAIHAIAARLPDAFIQNSVGTRFEFS